MAVQLSPSQRQALLATLHEFERTPGRFSLSLREPRLLFDEAHAVLWLAAGRSVEELGLAAEEEASARRAARFFVRTALLRQGSDHYTLLGLTQAASSEQVREHYRLMIRLTHPDFEAGGEHWPSDAASRINIANDVLSSAVRRREYDESLQAAAPPVATHAVKASPVPTPSAAQPASAARRKPPRAGGRWSGGLSTRTKAVLAGLGALLSAGALWLLNGTDSGSLTARQRSINDDTAPYVESGLGFGLGLRPAPPSAAAQPVARSEGVALARPTATQPAAAAPGTPAAAAPVIAAPVRMATAEADTVAGVSLQIARQLTAVRAEPVVATAAEVIQSSAPAPAPVAAAAPAPVAVVAVAAQRLTMQQVHPLMSNVLASLPSGRGETLAQWIAPEWRSRPANQAFVSQFNQWLAGQRVKEVNKIALSSQAQGDNLIVDGVVQVTTQQTAAGEQARSLRLRALFQPQDGQAVLTQLTASEPQ